MGLYYVQPPPHIGAAQPVTAKELTPPSGPLPSNPVFGRVSLAATLVVAAWSASAASLPQSAPQFIPPPTASAAPIVGARVPRAVLTAWLPAPPLPPSAINLDPPISGPVAQRPPVNGGAQVSQAALIAWLPPPPQPPSAINLDPPISGPTPQAPPIQGGASVPEAVSVWWIPPPPLPPAAVNLDPPIAGPTPQNPPFNGGAKAPAPVLVVQWLAPPPLPPVAINLDPPISAPLTLPVIGSRVPQAVLVAWLPPQPQSPQAVNLDPPISGAAPQNPPKTGPTNAPSAVFGWWLSPPPLPTQGPSLLYVPAAAQNPPFGTGLPPAIEISWASSPAQPPVAGKLNPPISAPQNPPFDGGSSIPEPVLVQWLAPASPPQLPVALDPPISGPVQQVPPGTGPTSNLEAVLGWWQPPQSAQLARSVAHLLGPQNPPFGLTLPAAIGVSWGQPVSQPAITAARLIRSGPVPDLPPKAGRGALPIVMASWLGSPVPMQLRANVRFGVPVLIGFLSLTNETLSGPGVAGESLRSAGLASEDLQ